MTNFFYLLALQLLPQQGTKQKSMLTLLMVLVVEYLVLWMEMEQGFWWNLVMGLGQTV